MQLSKEEILTKIGDAAIFERYLATPSKKKITNPVRNDNHPDCTFFQSSNGRILFTDWALGITFDCFDWIQYKYNVDFRDALKIIHQDFNVKSDLPVQKKEVKYFTAKDQRKPADFDYLPIKDKDVYKRYWYSMCIGDSILEKYNVDIAEAVYLNGKLYDRTTPDNPIYVYNFPSGRRKFYKPFSPDPKKKFYGNATANDINGLPQIDLSLGGPLIITKSLKDVMVLRELGYNAIAPQGENMLLPKHIIEWGRETFGEVILFFDNDGTFWPKKGESGKGKAATKKYFEAYQIPYIFIPEKHGAKDISDFILEYGEDDAFLLMEDLLLKENLHEEIPQQR